MLYNIIVGLANIIWHIVFRIKVIGRENLVKGRGCIICPNHISAIDPVFVAITAHMGNRMLILGKEELFEKNWFISWFLKTVNVLPVHRGKGDTAVLDKAIEDVKQGAPLLIFPEGTRTKDGNLGRLKSGAFVVADQAGVDMVPCRIIYRGGKMRVFGHCTVVYGAPIPAAELSLGEEHSAAKLRACKQRLEEALEALLEANKEWL